MSTDTDKPELHLWEIDHPYYCSEGNYYERGNHERFESWADFAREGELLYDFDDDLNLLFRWDWKRARREDYIFEGFDGPEAEAEFAEASEHDSLLLFFMLQRKARNMSAEVLVTADDELAVREWLTKKAAHMALLWQPFLEVSADV